MRAGKRRARRQARRDECRTARRRCAPRTRKPARQYTRPVLRTAHQRRRWCARTTSSRRAGSARVAHRRARAAHAEPEAAARVVLRPRAVRRHPRRHRLAPGRPVPRFTGRAPAPRCSVDGPRPSGASRASRCSASCCSRPTARPATPASTTSRPAASRPAWGDVRFTVVGTEGYLEVRHVDQTVLVVDGERQETIDCTEEPAGWGARYLDGTLITRSTCSRSPRSA